jgi:hypothetical protein
MDRSRAGSGFGKSQIFVERKCCFCRNSICRRAESSHELLGGLPCTPQSAGCVMLSSAKELRV